MTSKGLRYRDYGAPLKVSAELYAIYDWASFTVADATTDYDVDSQQSDLFKNVATARGVIIWSDQDVSIRFNNTSYPAILHEAVYSPHEWFDKIKMTNIYITNTSGNSATIKIFLV